MSRVVSDNRILLLQAGLWRDAGQPSGAGATAAAGTILARYGLVAHGRELELSTEDQSLRSFVGRDLPPSLQASH